MSRHESSQASALPVLLYLGSITLFGFIFMFFKCLQGSGEQRGGHQQGRGDEEAGDEEDDETRQPRSSPTTTTTTTKLSRRARAWWSTLAAAFKFKSGGRGGGRLRLWKVRHYLISSPIITGGGDVSGKITKTSTKKKKAKSTKRDTTAMLTEVAYNREFLASSTHQLLGEPTTTKTDNVVVVVADGGDHETSNRWSKGTEEPSLSAIVFAHIESTSAVNSGNARVLSTSTSIAPAGGGGDDDVDVDATGQQTNDDDNWLEEEEEGDDERHCDDDTRRDKLNDRRREEQRPAAVVLSVTPAGQMSKGTAMAGCSRPTLISRHLSVQVGAGHDGDGGGVAAEEEEEEDPIYDVPPSKSMDPLAGISHEGRHHHRSTPDDAYVHSSTPNLYLLAPIATATRHLLPKRRRKTKQHHQTTAAVETSSLDDNNNKEATRKKASTTTTTPSSINDIVGHHQHEEEREVIVITSYKARGEGEEDSIYDTPSVRSLAIDD